MKTNEQLQEEIDVLKNTIAQLEFDQATQPNADWEPTGVEGYIIGHHSTLENIW